MNPFAFSVRCAGLGTVLVLLVIMMVVPGTVSCAAAAAGQTELSYQQYQNLAWTTLRLNHMAQFEPLDGEAGMCFVVAERFGSVQVFKKTGNGVEQLWKSKILSGIPEEVLVADLSGDGMDDSLLCRTDNGMVYAWALDQFTPLWETLTGEYTKITCFTVANLDDDDASEIAMMADGILVQVDGKHFTKDHTGINQYPATEIRCGDVDGDGRNEVVLNSGQVIDPISGSVEWEEQTFYSNIELLDVDGDGMPEILTENDTGGPLKVFDVDRRSEVRFQ